jgi:hypothetical protein
MLGREKHVKKIVVYCQTCPNAIEFLPYHSFQLIESPSKDHIDIAAGLIQILQGTNFPLFHLFD